MRTPITPAAFWGRVTDTGDCWTYQGARFPSGYGRVWLTPTRRTGAHRYAYMLAVGKIPAGQLICHHCDNRPCVRPSHLFVGSYAENTRDAVAKGRHTMGERHPRARLTPGDIVAIRRLAATLSAATIARRYGLTDQAITAIVHRRTWKHVPPADPGESRAIRLNIMAKAERTHCQHGHAYTEANTLYERDAGPAGRHRRCRTCKREQRPGFVKAG